MSERPESDGAWFRRMSRAFQANLALKLLARNDTQCFSTQQYIDAYDKTEFGTKDGCGTLARLCGFGGPLDMGRFHLRAMRFLRETHPDVWTFAEGPGRG